VSLQSRRTAIAACRQALAGLRGVLVACSDRDLGPLAGELAEVRALAGAGIVAVTAEAEARGVVAASQAASTAAWVADAAWQSRREAATIAKTAALLRQADCEPVADAVAAGDVDLPSAVACGEEYGKLAPDLTEQAKPAVLEHLLDIASAHGPTGVRRLKDEILARYGDHGTFEQQCEHRRRHIDLSAGRHTASGLWHYRFTVDGEGRAVLEAAIGPDSAPKPPNTTSCGEVSPIGAESAGAVVGFGLTVTTRDTRPVGRRRGEALIDAPRRSVTAAQAGRPPTPPKAILMLTMNYQDLATGIETRPRPVGGSGHAGGHSATSLHEPTAPPDGTAANQTGGELPVGAAAVLGSRATGELLDPGTVRRIACDAGVIPAVLGSRGEILDQGRLARVFTSVRCAPCGAATGTAPSPTAAPPPPGATPTTSRTGSTADRPTCPTPQVVNTTPFSDWLTWSSEAPQAILSVMTETPNSSGEHSAPKATAQGRVPSVLDITLVSAIALTLYVAYRIGMVSGWNPQTALSVVRSVSTQTVMLGTLVSVLPVLALPMALILFRIARNFIESELAILVVRDVLLIAALFITSVSILIFVALAIAWVVLRERINWLRKVEKFIGGKDERNASGWITPVILVILFITPTTWLPSEIATFADGKQAVHVVNADETWFTYINADSERVISVHTNDVLERQTCAWRAAPFFSFLTMSAARLSISSATYPDCREVASTG
jgi:hypothetical protein